MLATTLLTKLIGRDALGPAEYAVVAILLPAWLALAHVGGLYHASEKRIHHTLASEVGPLFVSISVWSWLVLLGWAVVNDGSTPVVANALLWAGALLFLALFRSAARSWAQQRPWYRQRVYLVGSRTENGRIAKRILRHPDWGLEIAGEIQITDALLNEAIAVDSPLRSEDRPSSFRFGGAETLERIQAAAAERVIVAGWSGDLEGRTELVRLLANAGINVDLVAGEPEALVSAAVRHHIEGVALLTVVPPRLTRGTKVLKRGIDVIGAGLGLLLLSPLLAAIAVAIKLDSPGPVFFRQRRIGKDGNPFDVLKFRSMCRDAEQRKTEVADLNRHGDGGAMFKVEQDPRVTRVGRWLRRFSLDELPQLWDVLKGQMSLVGPRPLIPEEARLLRGHHQERFSVRPGITGPWQTFGRSDIPFEDMVRLDYTYVAAWTLREDLGYLLSTAGAVIKGRGAY